MTVSELKDRMSYEELMEWHTVFLVEYEETEEARKKAEASAKSKRKRL